LQRAKRFISGVLRHYVYSVRDDIAAGKDISALAEFIAASASERRPNLQLGTALKFFYARFERLRQSRSALLTVDAGFAKYESPQNSDDRAEAESVRCDKHEFPLLRREFLYQKWRKRHQLTAVDVSLLEQRMRTLWAAAPSVHVVLIDTRGSDGALEKTVASVVSQIYPEWGLSIISNEECVIADLDTLPHIEWLQTCDVAWALRHVVEQSPGEWICFLFSGDVLERDCFVSLLDLADVSGACEVLYADADSVDEKGECFAPEFKPDFDIDLLRSSDFFGNGCLLRTETIRSALQLVSFEDFGFLYGLLLSIAERNGEAAFVHDSKVLFHSSRESKAALFSQRARDSRWRYLESHLDRLGMKSTIAEGYIPGTFRVDYLHDKMPLVSIIIPTKDSLGVLRPCVESLLEKTGYRRFEVLIVDNNSEKPETLAFLDSIQKRDPRVRVLTYPKPYNFSRINNFAVEHATGEYLLLLNNDTAVLHENWLEQMLSLGQREDVGIVGARLLHPDNTVQHAGVVVGMSGVADHPEIGLPAKSPGYLGQAQLIRGMSAVTAACLLIEKSLYLEVRGLDEDRFAVLFNDVDLCLKVKQRGLRVLWTPYACLMHHGSFSLKKTAGRHVEKQRGRREALAMLDKWMPVLARDGCHNINLSLMDRAVQPETLVDANWDMHRRDRMRVLAFPFDSWGTGHYRVRSPLTRLQEEDRLRCSFAPEHAGKGSLVRIPQPVEVERMQPDVLFLHAALHDVHVQLLEQYRKYNKSVFKVFGLDDLLHSPPPRHRLHNAGYKDIKKRIRKALSMCDRLVVSTEPLAEAYADMIDDIGVIPNALDPRRWLGIDAYKRTARKPRVGWAGGRQHGIDLDIIVPVMTEIGDAVEWVFLGDKPQGNDRLDVEFHEGVFFDEYPAKLASLNLDLAIAPLHVCAFNEAKSNLRILEYGIFGIPVVCTDIYPYQDAPVTRVKNRASDWINAIREHVHDVAEAERKGTVLQRWVKANYMLDRYQDAWVRALDSEAESAASPETAFRERFCQAKP
jgi:GT2 family glycosyltransferase